MGHKACRAENVRSLGRIRGISSDRPASPPAALTLLADPPECTGAPGTNGFPAPDALPGGGRGTEAQWFGALAGPGYARAALIRS